jgi:probable rRNA maturation factor
VGRREISSIFYLLRQFKDCFLRGKRKKVYDPFYNGIKKEYNRTLQMIEVNNLTQRKISKAQLVKVAERVLQGEKLQEKELSIALVGQKKSRTLNKKHRNKDKTANVLSFPAGNESGVEEPLGEIVLCPAEIEKDAKKYGMMFEQALSWMLIHGILHLGKYSHKKEKEAKLMEQKEQKYLNSNI